MTGPQVPPATESPRWRFDGIVNGLEAGRDARLRAKITSFLRVKGFPFF
jgi:hypothetical protein